MSSKVEAKNGIQHLILNLEFASFAAVGHEKRKQTTNAWEESHSKNKKMKWNEKKKSWKTFQTRSVPSLAHVCVGRKRYGALRGQTGFRWCAGQQICHHRGSNLIDSRFSLRKRRAVCAWASTSDGIYFIVRKRFLYRFSWPNRAPTASAKSMTTNWQLGFCFFSRASRKPNDFIKTFLLISFPKDCPARVVPVVIPFRPMSFLGNGHRNVPSIIKIILARENV